MTTETQSRLVLLSDGQRVDLNQVAQYSLASTTITFTLTSGGTVTYSATNAASVMALLDQVKQGQLTAPGGVVPIPDASLTWVSTSATIASVTDTSYVATITGTGFTQFVGQGLGIMIQDTHGHVFGLSATIDSDTSISVSAISMSAIFADADTWTITFHWNGGGNASTGLTVVVS